MEDWEILNKEPTHENEVGSTILKGFKVPSGFVLHYEDMLGEDKIAREGEYVNTKLPFSKVMGGEVPGWNLQKVQSRYDFTPDDPEIAFEDYTFTPWGEKTDVLGVPLLDESIISKVNRVKRLGIENMYKYPELGYYLSTISDYLTSTYNAKIRNDRDAIKVFDTINDNIHLLLTLENTDYIRKLFTLENKPDITDTKLPDLLRPSNSKVINLNSLSEGLLNELCSYFSIKPEEFVYEVEKGMTSKQFEEKYGEYIKVNSIDVDGILMSKIEAKELIQDSVRSIPPEIRPLVISFLGGEDLMTQDVSKVIKKLQDADYFYDSELSIDDFNALSSKDELSLGDIGNIKVEGMDYIIGRFEILKKVISKESFIKAIREYDSEEPEFQPVRDAISEIVENYIDYLGGDVDTYRALCKDWSSSKETTITKAFKVWARGDSNPDVRQYRDTFNAVQSAHSAIYEGMGINFLERPIEVSEKLDTLNLKKLSIKAKNSTISMSFNREMVKRHMEGEGKVLLRSNVPPQKVLLIPSLLSSTSYWKVIDGKRVYLNRTKGVKDMRLEVVCRSSDIIVKDFNEGTLEVII